MLITWSICKYYLTQNNSKMLKYQIIKPLRQSFSKLSPALNRYYSTLPNRTENNDDNEEKISNARKLKKWRNETSVDNDSIFKVFGNLFSETDLSNENSTKDMSFKSWYKAKQHEYLIWSQRYIQERHQVLGNQLAVSHFILHRGGKVKRKGDSDYLTPDDIDDLPATFNPNWWIDEIDISGTEICYEGLENFKNLKTIRRATLKGCIYFDDWCLEKFLSECPNVEYLDISDCPNVTERGIEGLYRSWHLKHLVVTDFNYGAAFELTCLMLEDCMPGLKVEIIKTPMTNQSIQ